MFYTSLHDQGLRQYLLYEIPISAKSQSLLYYHSKPICYRKRAGRI